MASETASSKLLPPIDPNRDHVRGGSAPDGIISVVVYGDYLCPYCRRLRHVLARLRQALGERLAYVFRQFPNERAHPGATLISRAAEAAAKQGRFWQMHDLLYEQEPPLTETHVFDLAHKLSLDTGRFRRDLDADETRNRVEEDLAEGKRNGVTGTPTLF